jgi:hypothetical protein
MDSVEEDNKSNKANEVDPSSLNSEIKPLTSKASLPYPVTRAEVQHQSTMPPIIEASFILTFKQWRELFNSFTREMKPGWTNVIYERVRSCNFHCTLIFKNHHIVIESTRKRNSSFFRCIAICKSNLCE